MSVLCIIPARGGSKRLPRKNLLMLGGKPLVVHSIEHGRASARVTKTIVSTDDDEVAQVSRNAGAEVVRRPEAISGDTATSESALVHALDEAARQGGEPDLVVFLQPTSPVRKPDDIDRAIARLEEEDADSLFSACKNDKLLWRVVQGRPESLNYDYRHRKREQDMAPEYRENGSLYVFKPWVLRKHQNRLGGKMSVYEMGFWSSFQVDDENDLRLMEWILSRPKGVSW